MAGPRDESFSPAASWSTEDETADDDMDFEVCLDARSTPLFGVDMPLIEICSLFC